jgi:hypothetical protein
MILLFPYVQLSSINNKKKSFMIIYFSMYFKIYVVWIYLFIKS